MLIAALAAFVSSLLAACDGGTAQTEEGPVDKGVYIAANEAALDQLPPFPGAELDSTQSSPYYDGDSGDAPVSGYTTHRRYTVPDGTTDQEVVDFYLASVPDGWTACEDSTGVIDITERGQPTNTPRDWILFVRFSQGQAYAGVDTTELWEDGYAGAYTVTADYLSDLSDTACP